MKMFTVHQVKDSVETYCCTVTSAQDGMKTAKALQEAGADYCRVRDCLGGLRFEYNLKTGRKTA